MTVTVGGTCRECGGHLAAMALIWLITSPHERARTRWPWPMPWPFRVRPEIPPARARRRAR